MKPECYKFNDLFIINELSDVTICLTQDAVGSQPPVFLEKKVIDVLLISDQSEVSTNLIFRFFKKALNFLANIRQTGSVQTQTEPISINVLNYNEGFDELYNQISIILALADNLENANNLNVSPLVRLHQISGLSRVIWDQFSNFRNEEINFRANGVFFNFNRNVIEISAEAFNHNRLVLNQNVVDRATNNLNNLSHFQQNNLKGSLSTFFEKFKFWRGPSREMISTETQTNIFEIPRPSYCESAGELYDLIVVFREDFFSFIDNHPLHPNYFRLYDLGDQITILENFISTLYLYTPF